MKADIYIVSSITKLHRCNGIVGVVIEAQTSKGPATLTKFGIVEDVTKNQSVLLGIKYALTRISPKADAVIHIDDRYAANGWENGWIEEWVANNWHTSKGKEVANAKQWQEILAILGSRQPQFVVGEDHTYKSWLETEVKKRAKAHNF